jgi:hypothetical protein
MGCLDGSRVKPRSSDGMIAPSAWEKHSHRHWGKFIKPPSLGQKSRGHAESS